MKAEVGPAVVLKKQDYGAARMRKAEKLEDEEHWRGGEWEMGRWDDAEKQK